MRHYGFLKNQAGVSRILEAVISAAILFVVFSVATFLAQTSDLKILQERSDLDRLGYNVLNNVMESGAIENIEKQTLPPNIDKVTYLRTAIQTYLPTTVYFNLTIYEYIDQSPFGRLDPFIKSVANADSFKSSTEISSTDMVYTSKNGNTYYVVLVLARAGGGS